MEVEDNREKESPTRLEDLEPGDGFVYHFLTPDEDDGDVISFLVKLHSEWNQHGQCGCFDLVNNTIAHLDQKEKVEPVNVKVIVEDID